MAVYNTAFSVYIMALTLATSGVPFAITTLVAKKTAMGDIPRGRGVVVAGTWLLSVIGAAVSVVLFCFAEFFAYAMKEPEATEVIRAIAPSVLLVAIGAGYKAGLQGESDMLPTGVSQCVEAVVKLLAGYGLALAFIGLGRRYATAGAIAGVTVGELVATVILMVWYLLCHKGSYSVTEGAREEIWRIALPLWGLAVITGALSVVDTSLIRWGLIKSGLTPETARHLYGAYTGYAMTVLNLPAGFLATIGVSVVPVISGAVSVGNRQRVVSVTRRGIGLCMILGAMSWVVLGVWGELILKLLFNNTGSAGLLRLASPGVMFVCVMQFTSAVLQAMGKLWQVFWASVAVGVIKLLFAVLVVSIPEINIVGVALGSNCGYFVGMVMNLVFLSRAGVLDFMRKVW